MFIFLSFGAGCRRAGYLAALLALVILTACDSSVQVPETVGESVDQAPETISPTHTPLVLTPQPTATTTPTPTAVPEPSSTPEPTAMPEYGTQEGDRWWDGQQWLKLPSQGWQVLVSEDGQVTSVDMEGIEYTLIDGDWTEKQSYEFADPETFEEGTTNILYMSHADVVSLNPEGARILYELYLSNVIGVENYARNAYKDYWQKLGSVNGISLTNSAEIGRYLEAVRHQVPTEFVDANGDTVLFPTIRPATGYEIAGHETYWNKPDGSRLEYVDLSRLGLVYITNSEMGEAELQEQVSELYGPGRSISDQYGIDLQILYTKESGYPTLVVKGRGYTPLNGAFWDRDLSIPQTPSQLTELGLSFEEKLSAHIVTLPMMLGVVEDDGRNTCFAPMVSRQDGIPKCIPDDIESGGIYVGSEVTSQYTGANEGTLKRVGLWGDTLPIAVKR